MTRQEEFDLPPSWLQAMRFASVDTPIGVIESRRRSTAKRAGRKTPRRDRIYRPCSRVACRPYGAVCTRRTPI